MADRFDGFDPKALTFLRQLKRNNDRAWFTPRKAQYDVLCREPMLRLVELINDDLRRFAVDHVVDEPRKALFRIYRDTRFSNDKTPYKTHVGVIFPHRRLDRVAGAGFYFHISPTDVEIAGGLFRPGPAELKATRAAIAERPEAFRKLVEHGPTVKRVDSLQGEAATRVPKPFDANHPAERFLRMKQWYFDVTLPPDAATQPDLLKQVLPRFRAMAPLVAFLNDATLKALVGEEDERPRRPEPMF